MERLIDARGLRPGIAWPARGLRPVAGALFGLVRQRTLRRRVLVILAVLLLAGLGYFGLRRSPLVSVTHVRVSGAHGLYSSEIARALTAAARRQTTMAVDVHALRAAVARFAVVRDLRVSTGFPHTLRVTVIEQLPVAVLLAGSRQAVVAGDGVVLGPAPAVTGVPAIAVPDLPQRQVTDPRLLSELEALSPAPALLLRRVSRVFFGPQGLTVVMRGGLQVIFGDSSRAHAKWVAATLVIGDPGAAAASYIDVRLPDRPTAGGLSHAPGGSGAGTTGAGASTQAGLVATLAAALAGSSSGATGAAGATPPAAATAPGGSAPAAAAGGAVSPGGVPSAAPAAPATAPSTVGSTSTGG